MVDSIRFYTEITIHNLNPKVWRIRKNDKKGEMYYYKFENGVRFAFYPQTNSLIIGGRLINLCCNDKISNYDDLFTSRKELICFFKSVNIQLNSYLQNITIDIMKLKITRIDYCFNVHTPFVEEYIEFFNLCYKNNAGHKFSKLTNYTEEFGKPYKSSCYLKTNGDYENKTSRNYVINFYNKLDELIYKRNQQIEKYGRTCINDEVLGNSANILRLEVQVDYNLLRKVCERFKIKRRNHNLEYLFDINIARFVVEEKIEKLFTSYDFYSYAIAKKILVEHGYSKKDKIFEYIYKVSHHQKTSSYKKYEEILKSLNIYPYMFLPKEFKIEMLENPIKLIEDKINSKKLDMLYLKEREVI